MWQSLDRGDLGRLHSVPSSAAVPWSRGPVVLWSRGLWHSQGKAKDTEEHPARPFLTRRPSLRGQGDKSGTIVNSS